MTIQDTYPESKITRDRPTGFFDPAVVASAAAAIETALHGDENVEVVEEMFRASLQGELNKIHDLNGLRERFGLKVNENVWVGGLYHECAPDQIKPTPPPEGDRSFGRRWVCETTPRGCRNCGWVYDDQVFTT